MSSYFHQVVSCGSGMMLIELSVKLGHAVELWLQRFFQQNSIKTLSSGREISLNKHCFRVLEESSTRSVVWNGACSTVLTLLDATICISVLKGTVNTNWKLCYHFTLIYVVANPWLFQNFDQGSLQFPMKLQWIGLHLSSFKKNTEAP